MIQPALFLDRDGVINVDYAYVHKQEDFDYIDGIFELCRKAKQLGFLIFVITNQAGVGRGYYTEADFLNLTDWMCDVFRNNGVIIDQVYFCPFHPQKGIGEYKKDSPDRKPRPGMILSAAKKYNVDLARSVLVGNKESDIQAGIAAGVECNLLYRDQVGELSSRTKSTAVIDQLSQAEPFLESQIDRTVGSEIQN